MRYGLAALLLLVPAALAAQENGDLTSVPPEVRDRIEDIGYDSRTLHLSGPAAIGADSVLATDLVVEGGGLELAGRVEGSVVVRGGDLILVEGAVVSGDVIVVGGSITGVEHATVGGTILTYERAGFDHAAAKQDDEDDREGWDDDGGSHDHGHGHRHEEDGGLDLGLSIAGNYNRVEGLPIMFGPVVETRGPNRLHISGQAIWRTQPSASLDEEIGYQIRVQQGVFGDMLRIGGDVRSMARAIETRGLNSTEAGLAAVLFHSDLHDYHEDRSWGAHVELHPRGMPFEARIGYRDAEHEILAVSDPWSLFDRGDAWRVQPVVAQGDVSTLSALLRYDTRDDEDEPTHGVLISLGAERALNQSLVMPVVDLGGVRGGGTGFDDFTSATVDVRAYLPVNRSSTLNVRGLLAGNIDEAVLPPQFQHALGGIGTLPGFELFEGACRSREARVRLVTPDTAGGPDILSEEGFAPAYGCDRIALGQIEYRGGFEIGDREHDDEEFWEDIDLSADWAFFVDVGRGWSYGDLALAERGDTETMADVGFGLLFDQAGVYAAIPITGDDQSLRVEVRLQHRF